MKNFITEFTPESHLKENKFFRVVYGKTDTYHSVGLHKHDFIEIIWVNSGSGTLFASSKTRAFSKNFIYISNPHEVHALEPEKGTTMTFTEIVISKSVMENFKSLFLAGEEPAMKAKLGGTSLKLSPFEISYLDRAAAELSLQGDSPFAIYRFLSNLSWQLKNVFSDSFPNDIPDWLYEACQRIRNPENLRIGLEKFRQICGKDMSYINRSVRKYLNCTPTEFINEARLRYAKWMLETSSYTASEISEACGFSDVAYFCRKFKAKYDTAPMAFRKSISPSEEEKPFVNESKAAPKRNKK